MRKISNAQMEQKNEAIGQGYKAHIKLLSLIFYLPPSILDVQINFKQINLEDKINLRDYLCFALTKIIYEALSRE